MKEENFEIKKPNKLFPKMFRTFTMYIFCALFVFFGYVEIFGGEKINVVKLPISPVEAEENSVFSDVLNTMLAMENIDANVKLNFAHGQTSLSLDADIIYVDGNIALETKVFYNGNSASLKAYCVSGNGGFANSTLFVDVDGSVFKFDLGQLSSGNTNNANSSLEEDKQENEVNEDKQDVKQNQDAEISVSSAEVDVDESLGNENSSKDDDSKSVNKDVSDEKQNSIWQIVEKIAEVLNVDLSFIDGIEEALGIDFENISLDSLSGVMNNMEEIELKNVAGEIVGYKILMHISSAIEVTILADTNFYVKEIHTNDIRIGSNSGVLSAALAVKVDAINNTNVATGEETEIPFPYVESGDEIDLNGVIDYADFAANLFKNKFVQADVLVEAKNAENNVKFEGKLLFDLSDGFGVQFETTVEDVDVSIKYFNETIYLNAGSVALKFAVADFERWKNEIFALTEKYTGVDLSEVINQFISDLLEKVGIQEIENTKDLKNVDITETIKSILSVFGSTGISLKDCLPTSTERNEKSYAITWENGLKIILSNNNEQLDEVCVKFNQTDKMNIDASIKFASVQSGIEIDGVYYDVSSLLSKIKNLIDYAAGGVYGFNFTASFNSWDIVGKEIYDEEGKLIGRESMGTAKFALTENGLELEVVIDRIMGERFVVRVHAGVLYIGYGNMKIRVDISNAGNKNNKSGADIFKQINKLTSGQFGFTLDFGVFAEILDILENYTVQDYLDNMKFTVSGNTDYEKTDNLQITISNQTKTNMVSKIISLGFGFENEFLETVDVNIYQNISAHLEMLYGSESEIPDFNPSEYKDYDPNFLTGLFDSLEYSENVFAFTSRIDARYSTISFGGDLTAMFVKTFEDVTQTVFDESGNEIEIVSGQKEIYVPAISLVTDSLGLSTYIYLIEDTIYLDINGMQIKANINKIDETLALVEKYFGLTLSSNADGTTGNDENGTKSMLSALSLSITALDRIYGKWVTDEIEPSTLINGIEIRLGNQVARDTLIDTTEVPVLDDNGNQVYDEEGNAVVLIEQTFTNDISRYDGVGNVIKYGENAWLYNVVLQAYIQSVENSSGTNSTIVPTKVILGADIHDNNTVVNEKYDDYLLDVEEPVTSALNLAIYLTNIQVGHFAKDLDHQFISSNNFADITAVKSNSSNVSDVLDITPDGETEQKFEDVTELEKFTDASVLVEIFGAAYQYVSDMHFNLDLDGKITGSNNRGESTETTIGGKVLVAVDENKLNATTEDSTILKLFGGKSLNVEARKLTLTSKTNNVLDSTHEISLLYGSNGEFYKDDTDLLFADGNSGLYVSYSHNDKKVSNLDEGKYLRAFIENASMSDIIALILNFAGIKLSDSMMESWSLTENTVDFSFVKSLLGMNKSSTETPTVSKADNILDLVTNLASKMLHKITVSNSIVDGKSESVFEIDVDMSELGETSDKHASQIATIAIKVVDGKFDSVSISNLIFGGNTINLKITFNQYDKSKVKTADEDVVDEDGKTVLDENEQPLKHTYVVSDANFAYDTNASHFNFSSIGEMIETFVHTINTQSFNFTGTANVNVIGIAKIDVGFDILASIDENGKISLFAQTDIDPSGLAGIAFSNIFVSHVYSTFEYNNGQLDYYRYEKSFGSISQKAHGVYAAEDIMPNIMTIVTDALGFNSTIMNILGNISFNVNPSVEKVFTSFSKEGSTYSMGINGANLLGDGFKDFTVSVGTKSFTRVVKEDVEIVDEETGEVSTETREVEKTFEFIDSISGLRIQSGSALDVTVSLASKYVDADGDGNFDDFYNTSAISNLGGNVELGTNEYFRKVYMGDYRQIKFTDHFGGKIADSLVIDPKATTISNLPTLSTRTYYDVKNLKKVTCSDFQGWFTKDGTSTDDWGEQIQNGDDLPEFNRTVYAKWGEVSKADIGVLNIYHNGTLVERKFYDVSNNTTITYDTLKSTKGLAENFEFYLGQDNSAHDVALASNWGHTFSKAEIVDVHFLNYHALTFNYEDFNVVLSGDSDTGTRKSLSTGSNAITQTVNLLEGTVISLNGTQITFTDNTGATYSYDNAATTQRYVKGEWTVKGYKYTYYNCSISGWAKGSPTSFDSVGVSTYKVTNLKNQTLYACWKLDSTSTKTTYSP